MFTSCVSPVVTRINTGIDPRRSSRVCILTADLVERKCAQGNKLRQRSIVVESSAEAAASRSMPRLYRSAQIEQSMHLDGGLGGTKMRPGKQTQAKVDSGRIQRVGSRIEVHAEAF